MICQVIINDFEIGQRLLYILDDYDFEMQKNKWEETDELLMAVQDFELFAGRTRWMDLEIKHFHVLIVNILKMLSNMDENVREDKQSAPVLRLAFFLCGMVYLLQQNTDSEIHLFRITRVSGDDVLYDYNATLDVKIAPNEQNTELKIVIDNDRY